MLRKIMILRQHLPSGGRQWQIKNWDDYLFYLEKIGLQKPTKEYRIAVDSSTEQDTEIHYKDFEKQLPLYFHLKHDLVEYEIVDE